MLDIKTERIISLADATGILPRRRRGRKPHIATLYRWSEKGCRGVRLETCQVGGTRCTSVEALQRFIDRLSGKAVPEQPSPKRSGHERADRELREAGW